MQKGFTLIETLIYLALFSIIIGGVLVSAYQIIQASTQSQENALVQEEGHFLVAKINWALTGAQTISVPTAGTSSPTDLNVTKFDSSNPVFLVNADQLLLNGAILNSNSVKIENVNFTHTDISPTDDLPAELQADFRVTSKLTGQFQDFSTTKYLRK
ncbi:MAG: prepilin-type N-terminal cleavage/methylation domain-containing protein [bacterium]|nr:prepilin-type N-terminal cleavage/methylation domain-containing protein [bacterium]